MAKQRSSRSNKPLPPIAVSVTGSWVNRSWPLWIAIAYVAVRLPFIVRYDLWFGSDIAVYYLQVKRIMHGEIPLYFWSQDYYGTFTQFLVAAIFQLFGSSLILANFINVVIWSLSVGLAVAYVERAFNRRAAVFGGLVAVVGVPWFLNCEIPYLGSAYNLTGLIVFGFLWLGLAWVEKPGWLRTATLGLLTGYCFYVNKQVALPLLTLLIVFLFSRSNRLELWDKLKLKFVAVFVGAFLIGYAPEVIFLARESRHVPVERDHAEAYYKRRALLGFAPPRQMLDNLYWLLRTLPADFDGDPLWRHPGGIHYLERLENEESFPRSVGDLVGVLTCIVVIAFIGRECRAAYVVQDKRRLALALLPFINAGLVIAGKVTSACYYGAIRYFFPAGLVILIWTGIMLDNAVRQRRWAIVGLLSLFLSLSTVHRIRMLWLPDELRDFRQVVAEIRTQNTPYGVSWYPYAHVLTALSDEKICFAALDRDAYAVYLRNAKKQDDLIFVFPTYNPPLAPFIQKLLFSDHRVTPERYPPPGTGVMLWDKPYLRDGDIHECGELSWCRLKKFTTSSP